MTGNQRTIEVDERVYERFEEMRQGTQNEHVPSMSESMLLSSLLDTVEAVDRGYYEIAEDPTGQRMNGSDKDTTVPRAQVESALRFLERSHGEALRRPWSDEAHAYYNAIDILEGALEEELKTLDEIRESDSDRENVQMSRDARDEGYAAATLLDERFGNGEGEKTQETGLLSRLRRIVG